MRKEIIQQITRIINRKVNNSIDINQLRVLCSKLGLIELFEEYVLEKEETDRKYILPHGYKSSSYFSNAQVFGAGIDVHGEKY